MSRSTITLEAVRFPVAYTNRSHRDAVRLRRHALAHCFVKPVNARNLLGSVWREMTSKACEVLLR